MFTVDDLGRIVLVGAGATVVMDGWLVLLRRLGVPTQGFGLIGRWVGHLGRGRFAHPAIAQARPIRGELALGWATHYAVGVVFAALLVAATGPAWLGSPSLLPALAAGLVTVVAPLLVMQPAMGAGFAASRTKTPLANCARSVANHLVFGLGLYLSAALVSALTR